MFFTPTSFLLRTISYALRSALSKSHFVEYSILYQYCINNHRVNPYAETCLVA